MSKIEVNEISKTSTGSEITISSPVSMSSPLKIKSYQTSELSGLTPSTGEIIFDTDVSKLKVYTGSAWEEVGGGDFSAVGENIIPTTDITYDLGSNSYRWRDLYLSGSSIYLGDQTITASSTSISLSGSLKLKQYTTAQIDALTGMSDGEMVYDTDEKVIKVYNPTSSEWGSVSPINTWEATGGTKTTVGSDTIHEFTSSGSFVVTGDGSKSVSYLVIAGGGGGAGNHPSGDGGGGGAGGYRNSFATETSGRNSSTEGVLTLSAGTYTISVGAGGAGANGSSIASNGDDSSIVGTGVNITSLGGGGGNSYQGSGANGGSGGGGGGDGGTNSYSGGTGTSGQGFNGGAGRDDGGGGGGASSNGTASAAPGIAGAGGNGLSSSITGTSITRAGGGGAGGEEPNVGGTGGGGDGASSGAGTAGTVNTGGGGGGGQQATPGGNGGKGIVILRYAT